MSRLTVVFILIFSLSALQIGTVAAHGGGVPLAVNEPVGPYLLSLWLAPEPARVGTIHITAALSEPAPDGSAGEPILGAAVRILMSPAPGADVTPVGALATHQNATNRLFYEADLDIPMAGEWQMVVLVDGPAGPGESVVTLQILPEATRNWYLLAAAGLVVVGVVVLVMVTWRRNRARAGVLEPAESKRS